MRTLIVRSRAKAVCWQPGPACAWGCGAVRGLYRTASGLYGCQAPTCRSELSSETVDGGYCSQCAGERGRARAVRRALHTARRQQGQCVSCGGSQLALHGRTTCLECRAKRSSYRKAIYISRRERAMCPRCSSPAQPGRTFCSACLALVRRGRQTRQLQLLHQSNPSSREESTSFAKSAVSKSKKRWYRERRAQGMCTSCTARALAGQAVCASCKQRRAALAARLTESRRSHRLCVHCGDSLLDSDGHLMSCAKCRGRSRAAKLARYWKLRHQHRCVRCSSQVSPGQYQCSSCSAATLARACERSEEKRKAGECSHCDRPAQDGHSLCQRCRQTRASLREKKLASYTCEVCGKRPAAPQRTLCVACLVERKEKTGLGPSESPGNYIPLF